MQISVLKERKDGEKRVSLTPNGALELVNAGHEVFVEQGAGLGSGYDDDQYKGAGAKIVSDYEEAIEEGELILMVKEPDSMICGSLKSYHTMFTFFHMANNKFIADMFKDIGATAISYDTVEDEHGRLPLLYGMSEIAGKMATYAGAEILRTSRGLMLGGVTGSVKGNVAIIGGGVVGSNALDVACSLGANVTVIDNNIETIKRLQPYHHRANLLKISGIPFDNDAARCALYDADIIIGAALNKGDKTPHLIREEDMGYLREGAALIDISIDQGGCFEGGRPTTHSDPYYVENGLYRYNVANIPGAVPRTSTDTLTSATLPYIKEYAANNCVPKSGSHLNTGFNVYGGRITNNTISKALGDGHFRW